MISVRELATECGVSVQAIRKWCAKNNVERNAQGGYVITDEVRFLAVKHYKERKDGKKVSEKASKQVSPQVDALLRQLEAKDAQLAAKDEQIAAKDEQIGKLTDALTSLTEQNGKLLDTNKALSAATAIHTAADKKEALLVAEPEYEAPQQPQKKPSRWQRLLAAWRG